MQASPPNRADAARAPRRRAGIGGFLAAFALAALLPAWGFAGLAALRLAEAERRAVADLGRDAARNAAARVEREVAALQGGLVALATSPRLAAGDLAGLRAEALGAPALGRVQVLLLDAGGRQVLNTRRPADAALPTIPMGSATLRTLGTSRPQVSDVVTAPLTGRPLLLLTVPAHLPSRPAAGAGGAGVLIAAIEPGDHWSDVLRPGWPRPGWFTVLADGAGEVVGRSGAGGQPGGPGGGAVGRPLPAATAALADPSVREGWARGRDADGAPVYVAWARPAGVPWVVLAGVPAAAVDQALERALLPVLLGGAGLLAALAFGVGWFGSRRLARPLAALERAARSVGQGEVPTLPTLLGLREIEAALTALLGAATARREGEAELRAVAARLQAVLDHVPVGVVLAEAPTGRLVLSNRRADDLLGGPMPLGGTLETYGDWVAFHPDGRRVGGGEFPLARAVTRGEAGAIEVRLARRDGTLVWVRLNGAPIRDSEGGVAGAVVAITDMDATYRAAAALAASEERFRRFAEASPDVLWIGDASARRLHYVSPALERLWGIPCAAVLGGEGGRWEAWLHPDDRALVAVPPGPEGFAVEYRLLPPAGGVRWVRDLGFPIRDAAGAVTGYGGLARDVTAEREAAAVRETLIAELNHRVKNTLATVQSLALQTARGAALAPEPFARFQADFRERLLALSRAHDVLTARSWRGATLDDVVASTLSRWPARPEAGQPVLRAAGPAVWLTTRQALGLALALHELAANAARDGALGRAGGRVDLEWTLDGAAGAGQTVNMTWTETGGPAVARPTREGFGTRLLGRGLAAELGPGADVALEFRPAGLVARIRFRPLAAAPTPGFPAPDLPTQGSPPDPSPPSGHEDAPFR